MEGPHWDRRSAAQLNWSEPARERERESEREREKGARKKKIQLTLCLHSSGQRIEKTGGSLRRPAQAAAGVLLDSEKQRGIQVQGIKHSPRMLPIHPV